MDNDVFPQVDLLSKKPANLAADFKIMQREGIRFEEIIESTSGPEIRYNLKEPNNNIQAQKPVQHNKRTLPQNGVKMTEDNSNSQGSNDFYGSLTENERDDYDKFTALEPKLPNGVTAKMLIEAKRKYTDIYLLELASGIYIYKALTAQEDSRIKAIQGITQSMYMNHVISSCLLFPRMNPNEADSAKLAGTKNTLYNSILIYSDYQTTETISVKL
jgi:hypothetical protein